MFSCFLLNRSNALKVHPQVWLNFWSLKFLWKWGKVLLISSSELFSFPKYLNFCLEFLVMSKDGWIRKIRSMSKFMTSQSGKQTILIYILHNISRSKDNQTIAFHQLIKYNMRNNFYDKSYLKYGLRLIQTQIIQLFSDHFLKNLKSVYIWIKSLKFCTICFHCMRSSWLSKNIETKLQITCFCIIQNFFKQQKDFWI